MMKINKSEIVRNIIFELLSDRKMHCIQDVIAHVKEYSKTNNIEISDTIIYQVIHNLCRSGSINKLGKMLQRK